MACSKYSILIEGNIASGKSTVIKLLEKKLEGQVRTFTEPLDDWTNFCGENLLQKMYEDPQNNSFLFQTFVQYTMAKIQFEETPNLIKIAERSLISERYVFIEAIRVLNFISPLQYEVLNAWYQFLATKIPKVDEVIYLRTTPLIALGRLRGRNRTEEDTVNKEYLELLHTLHENWLVQNRQGPLPFKLTIINQDLPLKEIDVELDKIVERLKQMP
jgi:deoxyadenosine/deoxycytidine kinase